MPMLSLWVDDAAADEATRWAEHLGNDTVRWERAPLSAGEKPLAEIADWGPAEDWSDWAMQRGEVWFASTTVVTAPCWC